MVELELTPLLVGLVISYYLTDESPEVAEGIGNAMGMLIWSAQTILVIVLGLTSMFMIPKKNAKGNVETQQGSAEGSKS